MYWVVHVDNKCGHVSIALFMHNVQCWFGCVMAKIDVYYCSPYWAYCSFNVCSICASEMPRVVRKWLENLWLISSLVILLCAQTNLDLASVSSFLWCAFMGIVWAIYMRGVIVGLALVETLFANW